MIQSKTNIPKTIFQAQKIVQDARLFDYQDQYQQAITNYMQAANMLTKLLKKHPKMPFHKQSAHEVKICLLRVKQLTPYLINSTKTSKSSPVTGVTSKDELEQAELRERVLKNLITPDPTLSWDDIIGLDKAVHHIRETVVIPLIHPEILQSSIKASRAVLMFGPPGCGKTHIMKVIAAEIDVPIFHITAGTLLSKWHGESQKMIRAVYETAWEYAPSIIFIDEFDSIFGTSTSPVRGHSEDSRMAIQLQEELQQFMDGLFTPTVNETVTIVATNNPFHLTLAQLRRFDRILSIGPPSPAAIFRMLNHFLRKVSHTLTPRYLKYLAYELNGYTPDEIRKVCSNAYYRTFNTSEKNPPRKLTFEDFKFCLQEEKPILKPILRFKKQAGVSTHLFREWNKRFGLPPIEYAIQHYDQPFKDWEPPPNPIPLIDYSDEEEVKRKG